MIEKSSRGLAQQLVKPLARAWLTLRHQVFGRRYRRLTLETVDGVPLVIMPEVFNPVLFRTGAFLARTLAAHIPVGQRPDEAQVLDLGTGCGIGAIFAARLGCTVVGVDINPQAVRCARLNLLLNCLEHRVEIRPGDLFDPVAAERFDLVLFNPPFYRGAPRDPLDQAWRAPDVFERFAAGLRDVLTPGGRSLVVFSSDGDWPAFQALLRANHFEPKPVAQADFGNEVVTVYSMSLSP
jgi:methylase of polypeptide subunit release factors